MKRLTKALEPLRRKMQMAAFLRRLLFCLQCACALGILTAVAAVFFVMEKWHCFGVYCILAVLFACGFSVWKDRYHLQDAAKMADRMGEKERMVTALELSQKETQGPLSEMEQLALADGLQAAQTRNFAKEWKLPFSQTDAKRFGVFAVAAVVSLLVLPAKESVLGEYAQTKIERMEETVEKLEADETLTKADKQEVRSLAKTVEKDLRHAQTQKEAEKIVQEAQQELKQLEKDSISKDLKTVSEALSQTEAGKNLAQQAAEAKSAEMAAAMSELMKMLPTLSAGEKSALANALSQAAQEVDEEALAEALQEMAEAIANGELDLEEAAQALSEALQSAAAQGNSFRQGLQSMNYALGQTAAGQSGTGQSEGAGSAQGEGQGEGAGAGEGTGEGQGTGTGQGAGSGTGTGQGASSGQGRGMGHTEPEKVFSREASGKGEYTAQVDGQQTQNGTTTVTQQHVEGQRGQSVPYDTVYGQYRDDAMRALEQNDVPYGMKELVSDYFSQLER